MHACLVFFLFDVAETTTFGTVQTTRFTFCLPSLPAAILQIIPNIVLDSNSLS